MVGRRELPGGDLTLLDLVLSVVLAGVFAVSGGGKLAAYRPVVAQFERWRYAPSVRIAGGAMELASAGLILVPGLTLYGVLLLIGVLGTALYTHFVREKIPRHAVGALVLLVPVILLGLLRGAVALGPGGVVFQAIFG